MNVAPERQVAGAIARLEPMAGCWHVEGDVQSSAYGPASHWTSDERCEWLPGQRFLVNRWDARVGERDFKGMAVFGYDPQRGYFARFHDNAGNAPDYRVSIDGTTWTLTGEAQRAVYEFGAGTIAMRWELRDEKGWHPLRTLTARRVVSAAEVVHEYFAAFQAQDRATAERLLAQDFTFSSPRDDRIDRAAYFERCWPNAAPAARVQDRAPVRARRRSVRALQRRARHRRRALPQHRDHPRGAREDPRGRRVLRPRPQVNSGTEP